MGYSLAVHVRNDRLGKRMLKFMGKEYRKWSDVVGSKSESISTRELSDDISYGQKKGVIGFDYASHCHGWERIYVYCLTRWAALKVGRMRSKFKMDSGKTFEFPKPIPFISYDGEEDWPVIVVADEREAMKIPEDRRWCCVDRLGVYLNAKVNESLTMHCEDMFYDPKVWKAFEKDLKKLGEPSKEDRTAWTREHRALKAKHMKPEIDRMLPVVRKELDRLDRLWARSPAR